jgi:caa(3)-type oxidase subunit IV
MASNETPKESTVGHDHAVHDASGHLVHDAVAEDHGHAHAHVHPESHYWKIYGYLLVLFAISVTGPLFGHWYITLVTAFGVAIVKATLVVKHFMHLDVEQPFVHYFLATSLVFMFLFFAGVSPDVMNHHGTGWVNKAAKAETERVLALPPEEDHGGGEHGGGHAAAAPEGEGHEAAGHEPAAEPAH